MATHIFKIERNSDIRRGWGDYGDVLQHGMSSRGEDGLLALQRTGPYVPPITLPGLGDLVLTTPARQLLESSSMSGFSFRPVGKALTVELHWEDWDLNSTRPQFFPDSGEPEDYILGRPDSPSASAALGDLWEVFVPNTARIARPKGIVASYKELRLDLSTWNGADLFKGVDYSYILFSERARGWFLEHWNEYIEFDEFLTI